MNRLASTGETTPPTQLAIRRYFALRVGFGAVVGPAAHVVPHRDGGADGDLFGAAENVFDEQAQDALAFGDGRCGGLAAQPGEEVFEVVGELEVDLRSASWLSRASIWWCRLLWRARSSGMR